MKKIVVANLKSTLNNESAKKYANDVKKLTYKNLIICPGNNFLKNFNSNNYFLCLQDIDDDISFDYVKKYNVKYVILGHYEKRCKNETNKIINKKIKQCLNMGLIVILCVGNYKDQDCKYVLNQIYECIDDIKNKDNIILAYEPFYMINNNITLNIDMVKEYIDNIRDFMIQKYNLNSVILYGGNINENNINKVINICDGVLVGRLSSNVQNFTHLIEKI